MSLVHAEAAGVDVAHVVADDARLADLVAVGNLSALAAKSAAVWARVRAALLEMGRVGPKLPLSCPRHKDVKGMEEGIHATS